MSDKSRQWTLHYRSLSLTVQLCTLLLRHSSSYAADCSHRTERLLLHVGLHTLLARYTYQVQL